MKWWFLHILDWGYVGVFVMMAIESTIVPIPSEVIMPPAAYWAAQGKMNFGLLILAGALGSTFGSALCYQFSAAVGRPFVLRYGKYFLLPPDKLALAEAWLADYALTGIFFARLLPVLRHLIGFPAGLVRVPFGSFLVTTFAGSAIWCTILAVVGERTIGQRPDLLDDPEALAHVIKHNLLWFIGLVAIFAVGMLVVKGFAARRRAIG